MDVCEAESLSPLIIPLLSMLPLFLLMIFGTLRRRVRKAERRRFHFRTTYNLSVDRMLAESPIDKNFIANLKGRSFGRTVAVFYVMTWDPVPRKIAIKFVDAIWAEVWNFGVFRGM